MKKYVIKTISYTLLCLLIIAGIIAVFDPFTHYHKPVGGLAAVETDERSQMVGVARNMDYDTALIGSSMSENFIASWFNDGVFGDSTVKLCLQGAHFDDFSIIFDEVLKKPGVKNIVFSLDTYIITNNPSEYPTTIPEYLSNDSLLDDSRYLLNKSVLTHYLPRFLITNVREGCNADNAYVWADEYTFSKYTARGVYMNQRVQIPMDEKPYNEYFEFADEFLAACEPYIYAHPDVTFYMYSPPYSILFWDNCARTGNLTAEICALERVFKQLLTHDNVRIFYFQDEIDIITDLDNYRDYSHFDQPVNHYMYECMKNGRDEVTIDTYYDRLLAMYEFAAGYDYESAFH